MSAILFTKKDDLIEALEARRPWAKEMDKQLTARHKADEKAALVAFREKCRRLAKMSYADLATLRRRGDYDDSRAEFRAATCPMLTEAKLDRELAAIRPSRQQRFTITSERNSRWATVHWLLTHDENAVLTPC